VRSILKTKFTINRGAGLCSDGERGHPNKSGVRETGVQALRSVLIDPLRRNIEPQ
jgi:hypothetical protein